MMNTQVSLEQHLYNFLEPKGLVDTFAEHHIKYPLKGVEFNMSDPNGIFGSAFSYTSTPEGYDYWNTLYKEWKRYIKEQLNGNDNLGTEIH